MKNIENTTVSGRIILDCPYSMVSALMLALNMWISSFHTSPLYVMYFPVAKWYREWSSIPQLANRCTGAPQSHFSRSHPADQTQFLQPGESSEGGGGVKLIAVFIVDQMLLWLDFNRTLWNCGFFRLFSARLRLNCFCQISGVLHFSQYSQTHFHKREKRDWMVFVCFVVRCCSLIHYKKKVLSW